MHWLILRLDRLDYDAILQALQTVQTEERPEITDLSNVEGALLAEVCRQWLQKQEAEHA